MQISATKNVRTTHELTFDPPVRLKGYDRVVEVSRLSATVTFATDGKADVHVHGRGRRVKADGSLGADIPASGVDLDKDSLAAVVAVARHTAPTVIGTN